MKFWVDFKFLLQDNKDVDIIFVVPMIGELAQLGERNAGSVEVRGSSPLFSITKNPCTARVFLCLQILPMPLAVNPH